MFKKTLMAAVVAAFVAVFAASAAFAGETTGNFGTDHGKNNKQTPIGQPGIPILRTRHRSARSPVRTRSGSCPRRSSTKNRRDRAEP